MPDPKEYQTPSLAQSSFAAVQLKGSHNSYERHARLDTQLRFDASDPWSYGCRALEFDLHQGAGGFEWCVKHDAEDDDADMCDHLGALRDWSDARPGHDVIFVGLDLKDVTSTPDEFPDELDAFLAREFGAGRLVPPSEVHKQPGVAFWPSLEKLRRRFIFCLSGGKKAHKEHYARQADRLCFSDWEMGPASQHSADWAADPRVVVNFNGGHWMNASVGPQTPPGYVTRVWGTETEAQWGHFLGLGFNIVSTDHLRSRWARLPSGAAFSPR